MFDHGTVFCRLNLAKSCACSACYRLSLLFDDGVLAGMGMKWVINAPPSDDVIPAGLQLHITDNKTALVATAAALITAAVCLAAEYIWSGKKCPKQHRN